MHSKAGFGWADLCTFLVSCGLDIVSKGQDVTGGPRVYLKAYFTTSLIVQVTRADWLAGDITA